MCEISVINILIDIAIGLVCSFIWWLLFVLSGGKKKIDYLTTVAIDCARQFENSIEYEDYDTASSQADRLIDLMISIEGSIKPLTYTWKKRKLIRTYIYNVFYILTIFKNVTVGYSGDTEKAARCKSFSNKNFPVIIIDEIEEQSRHTLSFMFELVQELNRVFLVKTALNGDVGIWGYCYYDKVKKYKCLTEAVHPNGFKSIVKDFTRSSVFSFRKYKKYLARKMNVYYEEEK